MGNILRKPEKVKKTSGYWVVGFLMLAILAPFVALPRAANAQGAFIGRCGGGLLSFAVGYGIGLGKAAVQIATAEAERVAAALVAVPELDVIAPESTTIPTADTQASATGGFWENLENKVKEKCLDGLWQEIAKAIIRQMRNMVIQWIYTGNFGGTPTFVQNYQFDARQTAENATRIFMSKLTRIDFCNYFPQSPAVNLSFSVDLRLGLECSLQKSFPEFVAAINAPGDLSLRDRILLDAPENDPLWVELDARLKLSNEIAAAKRARETEVVSGSGFEGIRTCAKKEVFAPARYLHQVSGEVCYADAFGAYPDGCVLQPAIEYCAEYKQTTPGRALADLITEPIKSEFREGELVDEFGEAIAQIVNALVGKMINEGLNRTFGP